MANKKIESITYASLALKFLLAGKEYLTRRELGISRTQVRKAVRDGLLNQTRAESPRKWVDVTGTIFYLYSLKGWQ